MLNFPEIDPALLRIGPIEIRWYGLMYLLAFFVAWLLGNYRARKDPNWSKVDITDLISYCAWGVIIGGRLGYELFYNLSQVLSDPLEIFKIWHGGMSFHGGLIGVIISLIYFCKKVDKPFLQVSDFLAPLAPLGIAFVRIGNFINGELWGKETDVPWGMVFPDGGNIVRHPSQLYESFFEGLFLFIIIWIYSSKERRLGSVSSLFLILYSVIRFCIEFYREPDFHLGYVAFNWLTRGQLLSIGMFIGGIFLLQISKNFYNTKYGNKIK